MKITRILVLSISLVCIMLPTFANAFVNVFHKTDGRASAPKDTQTLYGRGEPFVYKGRTTLGTIKIPSVGSGAYKQLGKSNDRIKSVYIPAGFAVTFFENANFEGKHFVLAGPKRQNLPERWHNRISSAIIVSISESQAREAVNDLVPAEQRSNALTRVNTLYATNQEPGEGNSWNDEDVEEEENDEGDDIWEEIGKKLLNELLGQAIYQLVAGITDLGGYVSTKWKEEIDPGLRNFDKWRLEKGTQVSKPIEKAGQDAETTVRKEAERFINRGISF